MTNPPSKSAANGECRRIVLWSFWTLNMLLNVIYIGLSFATSSRLVSSYRDLKIAITNHAWRAPIAACVLGGLMVLLFNIMSCAVLIRKSINRSGPGFGYGFIMAWCFVMAFMSFLCGLVLDSFSDVVKSDLQHESNWRDAWTGAYYGTVVLAFICSVFYMAFFVCLVSFQGGISKTIGLYDPKTDEKRRMQQQMAVRLGSTLPSQTI